jgi:hypothetical protein
VYKDGYEHSNAVLLAHLASRLVDSSKQGLQLRMNEWYGVRDRLNTIEPEYLKPKMERGTAKLRHVMDILVIETIPEFQELMLASYYDNIPRYIPMDEDIRAFYEEIRVAEPKLIQELTVALTRLRDDWINSIGKYKQDQKRLIDSHAKVLSPKRNLKRTISSLTKNDIVLTTASLLTLGRVAS